MTPTPLWYTRRETADLLRVSLKTVDRMIKDDYIAAEKVGRSVRIPRRELRKLGALDDAA